MLRVGVVTVRIFLNKLLERDEHMKALPEFRLETHFARWEFKAQYHMTASDAQSMSLSELMAMASPEDRAAFEHLWLGYHCCPVNFVRT